MAIHSPSSATEVDERVQCDTLAAPVHRNRSENGSELPCTTSEGRIYSAYSVHYADCVWFERVDIGNLSIKPFKA